MKDLKGIDFNSDALKLDRRPISDEEIEGSKTARGAWVKSTVRSWGVPWPPPKGWLAAIKKFGVPLFDLSQAKPLPRAPIQKTPSKRSPAAKKPMAVAKPNPRKEFYLSWEWRTIRMEALKKHGAKCQCCGAKAGEVTVTGDPVRICVDHIKPLAKYWHLRLVPSNLQVLCDECNQGKGAWDETDWRGQADQSASLP